MNKFDFFAWDEGVTTLLHANGLFGHILDPLEPVDPICLDCIPSPLPTLSVNPTQAELTVLTCWWEDDNTAQHILVSKIGAIPCGLLPSLNLVIRTAFSIYQMLVRYYGTCSHSDCAELLNGLYNTPCTPGWVQEYISKWHTGLSCLLLAKFSFGIKMCLNQFVRGFLTSQHLIPYTLIYQTEWPSQEIRITVLLLF